MITAQDTPSESPSEVQRRSASVARLGLGRRVAVVQIERVARRVLEDRLVADARVERLGHELDAGGLELRTRSFHVVDMQRDRHAVGQFLPERIGLHDREGEVAGLELRAGKIAIAADERQAERLAVEPNACVEVVRRDGDEVDPVIVGLVMVVPPVMAMFRGQITYPINAQSTRAESPCEVFPQWHEAQLALDGLACEPRVASRVLRTTGFLRPDLAELVTDWFLGEPTASDDVIRQSYRALERETARLYEIVCRARSSGGLGVRVHYVRAAGDPYGAAAELCAELRRHRTMSLTTIARDEAHALLGGDEGGVVDQLRVVHDVFGHAALGVGFDLQSEFATWLQCRTLFSAEARGAAFCELVGAVTTYIATGEKPGLRADIPPKALVAACGIAITPTG